MSSGFSAEVVAGAAAGSAATAALVIAIAVYFTWRSRSEQWKAKFDDLERRSRNAASAMSTMIDDCCFGREHPPLGELATSLYCDVHQLVMHCTTNSDNDISFGASAYTAAAGDGEDWHDLLSRESYFRHQALTAFIMRVLIRRMHPDGPCDFGESLLPPDLLRIHLAVKAKKQAQQGLDREFMTEYFGGGYTREEGLEFVSYMWRPMIAYLTSEATPHEGFADNDPRLPAVVKLEDLIVRLLTPFDMKDEELARVKEKYRGWKGKIGSEAGRSNIRRVVVSAADLALKMFSDLYFSEFYFPPDFPPTQADGDRRLLVLPYIRQRIDIPGYRDPLTDWSVPEPDGSRWAKASKAFLSHTSLQGVEYQGHLLSDRPFPRWSKMMPTFKNATTGPSPGEGRS